MAGATRMADAALARNLVHENEQLKIQVDSWRSWAARLLTDCGLRGAGGFAPSPSRQLITRLAKLGAESKART